MARKARKIKDKWKEKKWVHVVAPDSFNNVTLGYVPITDDDNAKGRILEVTLWDILKGDPSQHQYKIFFQIDNVVNDKAKTIFKRFEYSKEFLRSLVRRGSSKVNFVIDVETQDNYVFRIKMVALTHRQLNTSRQRQLRLIAKDVIDYEIKALKKLRSSIGYAFDETVKTILNCKNAKVIISGVGKSGIIAKKWAATFSSTGTASFFLDAANASHGDMGQITSGDVVILISLSGQSEELKNIIQYANRNKILLIGIVSKKDSILYKAADIKLLIPQVKESGGIVPTSSTTVQLALGDALAIATMQHKKFDKLDFKKSVMSSNAPISA